MKLERLYFNLILAGSLLIQPVALQNTLTQESCESDACQAWIFIVQFDIKKDPLHCGGANVLHVMATLHVTYVIRFLNL